MILLEQPEANPTTISRRGTGGGAPRQSRSTKPRAVSYAKWQQLRWRVINGGVETATNSALYVEYETLVRPIKTTQ